MIEWVFFVLFSTGAGGTVHYEFLLPTEVACEARRADMATWYAPEVARVGDRCAPRLARTRAGR